MVKEKRKNLTIVVLGETSRGDNFSLSGYSRQTNPLLEKMMWSISPHHILRNGNGSICPLHVLGYATRALR